MELKLLELLNLFKYSYHNQCGSNNYIYIYNIYNTKYITTVPIIHYYVHILSTFKVAQLRMVGQKILTAYDTWNIMIFYIGFYHYNL